MQFCDPAEGSCVYVRRVRYDLRRGRLVSGARQFRRRHRESQVLKCGGELDDGGNLMLAEDFDQLDG